MTNDLHDSPHSPDHPTPADDAAAGEDALEAQFKAGFAQASYYSVGRLWKDYAPAYRFGRDARQRHAGSRLEDVERELEAAWTDARGASRLGWIEARGAVEDAWSRTSEASLDAGLDAPAPKVG